MRRWAVLTAFALLLPSCGWPDNVGDIEVSRDGPLPAEALGRCDRKQEPAGGLAVAPAFSAATSIRPWITNVLDPGVWLRVDRIGASGARRYKEKEFPGSYVTLGGEPALVAARPATAGRLRMDGHLAKSADAALRAGATVYLKLDQHDVYRIAVALRGSEYAFLGHCAYRPVPRATHYFGPHVAAYLAALAGKSRAETLKVLGYDGEPERIPWLAEVGWRTLGRGHTPPDVLRALRRGTFVVRAPEPWRGHARLCPLTYLGASGCVDLRDRAPRTFYYDPARPEVMLVVRFPDGALRLLTQVDLAAEARRERVDLADEGGVRLTVTLAADPPLREVRRRGVETGNTGAVGAVRVEAR